jgi:hypothetical protein
VGACVSVGKVVLASVDYPPRCSFRLCLPSPPTLFSFGRLAAFSPAYPPADPRVRSGGFGTFLASEQWSEGTLLFLGFSDKVRDHVEVWFGLL